MTSQDFFSIEVVGVFDFPGVGAILARTEVVGAVPVVFEVGEFINEFSPAVIDADFNLQKIAANNSEILIEHIAIRGKCVWYIKEGVKEDIDLALRCAPVLIGKINRINGVLIGRYFCILTSWARDFILWCP